MTARHLMGKKGVTLAASALAALCCAASAAAAPPPPADLQVAGGEEAWRPDRAFRLEWVNPAPAVSQVAAVHYRVRDPGGATAIGPVRVDRWLSELGMTVPALPGAYTAEVWLEDSAGRQGAPAAAALRFDNARPAATAVRHVPAWIGRASFPFPVRLERPPGPAPLSGIRGYAVAVDPAPERRPCAAPDRCALAETDLHGGVADDTLLLPGLPDGTSHLSAAPVSGAGVSSQTVARATLRVDRTSPVTRLSGVPAGWARQPVRLTATATDAGSGMAAVAGGASPFTAIGVDGATPSVFPGAVATATVFGEGVHRVVHYARDAAGNVDDGGSSNGARNPAPATAAVRIDSTPPRIAFAGSQDPRDPELIRARIGDALSGPDPARGWIGVRPAGTNGPFAPLPTLPPRGGELRARWDSEAMPAGRYEFRAVGHDAAGNAASTTRRGDGSAMALANPIKAATGISAGFGGAVMVWHRCAKRGEGRRCRRERVRKLALRPAARTVPHGRGVLLSGRLGAGLGSPLARMPVRVVERFAEGGPAERASTVLSGPGGEFSLRLAPGPSREVSASFAGTTTLGRTASRPLRLGVRGGVRLRASSAVARVGGAPIVFRGKVVARRGEIPADGAAVQLQFRLPGTAWSEFRTIRTDPRGRFRHAYRFSDDDSRGARFQFRAHAPAQGNWPYEPASSRPVAVRGR
jgi:hypothetical protein